MSDLTYDAVICGGGNKALMLAMYLTKYAGMSCGNASCHETNSIHRIIHVTDSGAGTQLMLTASGYESNYERPDFTPEIVSAERSACVRASLIVSVADDEPEV